MRTRVHGQMRVPHTNRRPPQRRELLMSSEALPVATWPALNVGCFRFWYHLLLRDGNY